MYQLKDEQAKRIDERSRDALAELVMTRYFQARNWRDTYMPDGRNSVSTLLDRCKAQYERRYHGDLVAKMGDYKRFFPLTQMKVNSTVSWQRDLVVNQLDQLFTLKPTPIPTLPKDVIADVEASVRRALLQTLAAQGLTPDQVVPAGMKLHPGLANWLKAQAATAKRTAEAQYEQKARTAAEAMTRKISDQWREGMFRQAYERYVFEKTLYPVAFLRGPTVRRRPFVRYSGSKPVVRFDAIPFIESIPAERAFTAADASSPQDGSFFIEVRDMSKAELAAAAALDDFFEDEILKLFDEYTHCSCGYRNWLDLSTADDTSRPWTTDETMRVVVHEGMVSGRELADYGISKPGREYFDAEVWVCGGRTIMARVSPSPSAKRTAYGTSFKRTGSNAWDGMGLAQMLYDRESTVNALMFAFERNAAWQAEPAMFIDPDAFTGLVTKVKPGMSELMSKTFGSNYKPFFEVGTQDRMASFMNIINGHLRWADDECGIPAFAYGNPTAGGAAATLGGLTMLWGAAQRGIKDSMLNDDLYVIEPMVDSFVEFNMLFGKDKSVNGDVNAQGRGATGILQKEMMELKQKEMLQLLLQGTQAGLIPKGPLEWQIHEMLQAAGFPTEQLGVPDPVAQGELDNVVSGQASTQTPTLDGRSPVPPGLNPQTQTPPPGGVSFGA